MADETELTKAEAINEVLAIYKTLNNLSTENFNNTDCRLHDLMKVLYPKIKPIDLCTDKCPIAGDPDGDCLAYILSKNTSEINLRIERLTELQKFFPPPSTTRLNFGISENPNFLEVVDDDEIESVVEKPKKTRKNTMHINTTNRRKT